MNTTKRSQEIKQYLDKKIRKFHTGSGEIVQWLRALAAITEFLNLFPCTHIAAHNCL